MKRTDRMDELYIECKWRYLGALNLNYTWMRRELKSNKLLNSVVVFRATPERFLFPDQNTELFCYGLPNPKNNTYHVSGPLCFFDEFSLKYVCVCDCFGVLYLRGQ